MSFPLPQSVNDKNTALANSVPVDVAALNIEDVEIVKNLATLPLGHPSITVLNARRATIVVIKKAHN